MVLTVEMLGASFAECMRKYLVKEVSFSPYLTLGTPGKYAV